MSTSYNRQSSGRVSTDRLGLTHPSFVYDLKKAVFLMIVIAFVPSASRSSFAQAARTGPAQPSTQRFLLYGDVKVDATDPAKDAPMILDLILYTKGMQVVARQRINPGGRYRFMDVADGDYWLVVESDGAEVARDSIFISRSMSLDIKHDISLTWRSINRRNGGGSVISSADLYSRSAANESTYQRATKEIESKNYPQAIVILRSLVDSDPNDFRAWSDLGMLYFLHKDLDAAENSYASAGTAKPTYFPAVFNLGRVRLARKNYEGAIESLEAALKLDTKSAAANYFLGESYLQIKKGSKAVVYFNEALALDPVGMADAHLRLAALYNGAGMKDKAITEYEQFLKAKPDYADRAKLEKYITDNRKP